MQTPRAVRHRASAWRRGYDNRWRKIRAAQLAMEPLCRMCLAEGKYTPATDVDHIIPHRGNPRLMYDVDNLQSLCHSCHSRKTVLEDGGFGKMGKIGNYK